jgi:hypothetical protein
MSILSYLTFIVNERNDHQLYFIGFKTIEFNTVHLILFVMRDKIFFSCIFYLTVSACLLQWKTVGRFRILDRFFMIVMAV